ncbi:hypothetical protein GW17_00020040 [Ensete ventricosum]|nr:hypothetical protein GW17_00020040 [Ensete ventricosum]
MIRIPRMDRDNEPGLYFSRITCCCHRLTKDIRSASNNEPVEPRDVGAAEAKGQSRLFKSRATIKEGGRAKGAATTKRKMAFHLVVLSKLKLLTGGGHSHWKLLVSLLCPFALKLPFAATCLSSSGADLLLSLRLFAFRLARIFLDEPTAAQQRRGRWERALRLLHERAVAAGLQRTNEETLNAISMLAL